jgi:hypothetical protein
VRVKLVRKLALTIDGVDISKRHVGQRFDLPPHDAEILIAEGWAVAAPTRSRTRAPASARGEAADKPRRPRRKRAR